MHFPLIHGLRSHIFFFDFDLKTDVYFLSNVKTVDDLTAARKTRLLRTTNWSQRMVQSMETWPCFSVLTELGLMDRNQILCAGCRQRGVASRMILYGQAYNPSTIEAIQLDHRITYEKVIVRCRHTRIHRLIAIPEYCRIYCCVRCVCNAVNCFTNYRIKSTQCTSNAQKR